MIDKRHERVLDYYRRQQEHLNRQDRRAMALPLVYVIGALLLFAAGAFTLVAWWAP